MFVSKLLEIGRRKSYLHKENPKEKQSQQTEGNKVKVE